MFKLVYEQLMYEWSKPTELVITGPLGGRLLFFYLLFYTHRVKQTIIAYTYNLYTSRNCL